MNVDKVTRFSNDGPDDGELVEWEAMDAASLESDVPVQRGYFYFNDENSGFMAGVKLMEFIMELIGIIMIIIIGEQMMVEVLEMGGCLLKRVIFLHFNLTRTNDFYFRIS